MCEKGDRCSTSIGREPTQGLKCAPSQKEFKDEAGRRRSGFGRSNTRCRSRMVDNERTDMGKHDEWETRKQQD